MALNKRRIARSQQTSRGGGDFFKLKDGKNTIRVFTFPHVVSKSDFTRGLYKQRDEVAVGDEFDELEREVTRHFTEDGIVNCPGANCPWCSEADKLLASDDKQDKKTGKNLSASRAFFLNVVDMEDIEKGMQIGQLPTSVFNAILNYVVDPEFGESVLGCKGRDFIIDRDSKEQPARMYQVRIRDQSKCEVLEDELQEQVRDMFKLPMLEPGWSSDEKLNMAKPADDEPPSRSSTRRAQQSKDEDDTSDLKDRESAKEDKVQPTGAKAPWDNEEEKPKASGKRRAVEEDVPAFKIGEIVTFEDEGKDISGEVKEINGDMSVIKAGRDLYDIPLNELKKKPAQSSGRRR